MFKPLYLDNAATTPLDPRVLEAMLACLGEDRCYGNPGSEHWAGYFAQERIDAATEQVAALLSCDPASLIWTSGATESINLALTGVFEGFAGEKVHIITLSTEHEAVLATCEHLVSKGADITYLQPQADGRLALNDLKAALTPYTKLISVMHVNNEIGVIQDIQGISGLAQAHGVLLHVDAAQSMGKLPISLRDIPVDLLSACAHKCYGPKGVGILYAKPSVQAHMKPLMQGGGRARLRPGTLPTHQIVGMGVAAVLAQAQMLDDLQQVALLNERLWAGIADLPGVHRHGSLSWGSPYILNVRFEGIPAQLWMESMPELAISSGSACNSSSLSPSHVLKSLGLTQAQAQASLRFSLGRFTTLQHMDEAIELIRSTYEKLATARAWWGKDVPQSEGE